jgi:hypothetical protein
VTVPLLIVRINTVTLSVFHLHTRYSEKFAKVVNDEEKDPSASFIATILRSEKDPKRRKKELRDNPLSQQDVQTNKARKLCPPEDFLVIYFRRQAAKRHRQAAYYA